MIHARISLIGAGPGDPELLTLKAWRAIRQADVILYDRLVNPGLLEIAEDAREKIYVGKTPFAAQWRQEDINQLLVSKALQYGHAVRLKGGDPFIFGRGFEEWEAARQENITVEVIPGISSSTGVPALAAIPLTLRGVCESVWIATGTAGPAALSADIRLALRSSATIVILMGMHCLDKIMALISGAGKSHMPVAVIQNGSLPDEKMVVATAAHICQAVQQKNISNPALIIAGEVVRHAYPTYFQNDDMNINTMDKSEALTAAHPSSPL